MKKERITGLLQKELKRKIKKERKTLFFLSQVKT